MVGAIGAIFSVPILFFEKTDRATGPLAMDCGSQLPLSPPQPAKGKAQGLWLRRAWEFFGIILRAAGRGDRPYRVHACQAHTMVGRSALAAAKEQQPTQQADQGEARGDAAHPLSPPPSGR